VRRRMAEAGVEPGDALVLGAVGTSDVTANAELADVAASMGATVGFAAGPPLIDDVVADVRRRGARQVAIAAYVLAPGHLPDRFHDAGADVVTEVLGAASEIVELVLHRYDVALTHADRLVESA